MDRRRIQVFEVQQQQQQQQQQQHQTRSGGATGEHSFEI